MKKKTKQAKRAKNRKILTKGKQRGINLTFYYMNSQKVETSKKSA